MNNEAVVASFAITYKAFKAFCSTEKARLYLDNVALLRIVALISRVLRVICPWSQTQHIALFQIFPSLFRDPLQAEQSHCE